MPGERVVVGVGRGLLVDVDVTRVDAFSNPGKTISLDDVVLLLNLASFIGRCISQAIVPWMKIRQTVVRFGWACRACSRSVGIFADEGSVLAKHLAPSIASVQAGLLAMKRSVHEYPMKGAGLEAREAHLILDERVLDIVAGITHDGNGSILPGGKPIVSDELDGLSLDHRLLRIHGEVEKRIDTVELIIADGADSLFAHSALIGVSRRLVMMRIRNEAGNCAENGERLDLQVSGGGDDVRLIKRDVRVIFLVYIKVLN